ncbi:glycoside hydrolase family 127 protein [bacterium]|nr:glycoside hydrolase family 127 protein [bacterium]
MKRLCTAALGLLLLSCGRSPKGDYYITPVPFTDVTVADAFWTPRLETNRLVTIPYAFEQCEETHRIDNFAVAAGVTKGFHRGYRFNDSDVYKIIEGAAYALRLHPDPELEAYVDGVIDLIAAAQEEDGYLFTAKTAFDPDNPSVRVKDRWDNIRDDHELYCVGHMYEAAVAYYQATGKRTLLDAAVKNADLIDSVFSREGLRYPPGHEEIEIGLARLYRETGEKRYLDLAKFFLDQRGDSTGHELYGEYAQDHMPVTLQKKAVGHAVRAGYLFTGMADIAALTGNTAYIKAIKTIWNDVAGNKLYLTGGIGASGGNEGFGGDYHLPNASAYCETCAAIANAMWNHRLFLMTGDAKYMDVAERTIYNNVLSGISMNGDRFFYPNRLASFSGAERSPWFGCACCPSNIVRFLPSIPGYAYAKRGNDLYVNLYLSSSTSVDLAGTTVHLIQESLYPWDGRILIKVNPKDIEKFTINLRIPGWAQGKPVPSDLYAYMETGSEPLALSINEADVPVSVKNGYVRITRLWQVGDEIRLTLPMPVRFVTAHDSVAADRGRLAVERGPLVYCAEGIDNADDQVRHLIVNPDAPISTSFRAGKLNGIQEIRMEGELLRRNSEQVLACDPVTVTLVPYYSWAHRGLTPMAVWLAADTETADPIKPPTIASTAAVSVSHGRGEEALNDQIEPASSIDHDIPRFHWWPRKGQVQWMQYDFKKPQTISQSSVYWFDDTGIGECRVPASWHLLCRVDGVWERVANSTPYTVDRDRFNTVTFRPVTADALRLEIASQPEWAGGILEWTVK